MKVKEFEQDFVIFASKAPVNHDCAKHKGMKAYEEIKEFFTEEERRKISIALSHAETGEGRGEFDKVVEDIKKRIRN